MSTFLDALFRAAALRRGEAICIRTTYAFSSDPSSTFGICPIRVVSEQRVQAIAFGALDTEPDVVTIWNPLSRETAELEPYAHALVGYFDLRVQRGEPARIWLPHPAAVEMIDILGHRYRNNRNASPILQRMGSICRAITYVYRFPGQQSVAVASTLLAQHVVTGQTPTEDQHLGSLLVWLDPLPGINVYEQARAVSLRPAAALLERSADDRVEHLRVVAKKGRGNGARAAIDEISEILREGALAEWRLLHDARSAFWGLGLAPASSEIDRLARQSQKRLDYQVRVDPNRPTRPHALAALLALYEDAAQSYESADVAGDSHVRAAMHLKGRVVRAETISIDQIRPNRKPCWLTLRSNQQVLRVRPGTVLTALDVTRTLRGRVESVKQDPADPDATILRLEVTTGVLRNSLPGLGDELEWTDAQAADFGFQRSKVYQEMKRRQPVLVYGDKLPATTPRNLPASDLLAAVAALRRS